MRHLLIIFLLLPLISCDYTAKVSSDLDQEPYFDLPSLVKQQLAHLDSLQPSVEVTAIIDGQQEVETVQKNSTDWAETLKLFSDANINRPVLQDQYQVKDSTDQATGWQVRIYHARQPDDVEIPYMAVYYQKSLNDVRKIETVFHEKNILYRTERRMEMLLENTRVGSLLTEYQSSGSQKMLFRDSVNYSVIARLRYTQPS
ncbi:MAG: hypothetical protein AAF944_21905 [Bacteroidota bacterium]